MKLTDPVCGMDIEPGQAAASETWQGRTFHLCSSQCHGKFMSDPAPYAAKAMPTAAAHGVRHQHRPG
jgi:Cu+-exporting ATPase